MWLILVYVALLFLLPSKFILAPPLGFTPIGLVGLLLFGVWAILRLHGLLRQPASAVHLAVLFYALTTFASYVAAGGRPTEAEEMNGADRSMVTLFSLAGVILLTGDGLLTSRAVRRVVTWIGVLLGAIASLALLQAALGYDPLAGLRLPGLILSYDWLTDNRSGFIRANGTAVHPIEYGAVVATGLPLLLHLALHARVHRRLWLATALLAAATLFLTVSRSAVIGLGVGLLVLLPTWPRTIRRIAYVALFLGIIAVRLAFPGVIGTIISAFTFFSEDPSTQGRSRDYSAVADYVGRAPWTGMGEGTFSPSYYRILDNQYLLTLVMQGALGLLGLIALFASAMWLAVTTRRRLDDPEVRSLLQSLLAGLAVAATSFALYDGLAFPQATGILLLLIGLIVAVRRIEVGQPAPVPPWPWRPWRLAASAGVGLLAAAGAYVAANPMGQYVATWTYQMRPETIRQSLFAPDPNVDTFASVVADFLRGDQGQLAVTAAGGTEDYTVARGRGSLVRNTEYPGTGDILRIQVMGDDAGSVRTTMSAVADVAEQEVVAAQTESAAPPGSRVVLDPVATGPPNYYAGRRTRLAAGLLATAAASGWLVYLTLPRVHAWRSRRAREENPYATT